MMTDFLEKKVPSSQRFIKTSLLSFFLEASPIARIASQFSLGGNLLDYIYKKNYESNLILFDFDRYESISMWAHTYMLTALLEGNFPKRSVEEKFVSIRGSAAPTTLQLD